jgi:hypothetical protein
MNKQEIKELLTSSQALRNSSQSFITELMVKKGHELKTAVTMAKEFQYIVDCLEIRNDLQLESKELRSNINPIIQGALDPFIQGI